MWGKLLLRRHYYIKSRVSMMFRRLLTGTAAFQLFNEENNTLKTQIIHQKYKKQTCTTFSINLFEK
jgi:hypothetical protein